MKPQRQITTGFVFMGIWTAMGCWALVDFLTDETAGWVQLLLNMGSMVLWMVWSLLQIRNGRRRIRAAAENANKT